MSLDEVTGTCRSERIALVERIFAARINGDFDYLESVSCDDLVVNLIGDKAVIFYTGCFKGKAAARQAFEHVHVNFSFHEMKIEYIMVDGDQVGLRWRGVLRSRGTGAGAQFQGFTHYVFENRLLKEYFSLADTASMSKLALGE